MELALVILAGPSLLGGLCFLAVAVGSAPLVVCLAVLAVALFAGALWAVDRMFTSWRQVCPGCKTRVS